MRLKNYNLDNIMGTIISIVIIIIILWLVHTKKEGYKKQCSSIDERCYPLVKSFDSDTFKEAADLLAYLNKFCLAIIRHMRDNYLWKDEVDPYKKKMAKYLINHYNPDSIIENNPKGPVNTSYVEDKGKVLAICLREKKSGMHNLHKKHELEFVVLHELSHLTNHALDHDDEFWKDFKILLIEAEKAGLHKPVDYKKYPFNYCSVLVDYSPYYDNEI
jgi:hypothetical protein